MRNGNGGSEGITSLGNWGTEGSSTAERESQEEITVESLSKNPDIINIGKLATRLALAPEEEAALRSWYTYGSDRTLERYNSDLYQRLEDIEAGLEEYQGVGGDLPQSDYDVGEDDQIQALKQGRENRRLVKGLRKHEWKGPSKERREEVYNELYVRPVSEEEIEKIKASGIYIPDFLVGLQEELHQIEHSEGEEDEKGIARGRARSKVAHQFFELVPAKNVADYGVMEQPRKSKQNLRDKYGEGEHFEDDVGDALYGEERDAYILEEIRMQAGDEIGRKYLELFSQEQAEATKELAESAGAWRKEEIDNTARERAFKRLREMTLGDLMEAIPWDWDEAEAIRSEVESNNVGGGKPQANERYDPRTMAPGKRARLIS